MNVGHTQTGMNSGPSRLFERCRSHVADYELPDGAQERIGGRFDAILERIEAEPKSRGWRMRAKIGERKRWYELPEEV